MAAAGYGCAQKQSELTRVEFNRDIRPILNKNCTACHGGVRQQGGVSFVYREEAMAKGKSGRATIVPGHPERSELISRITSDDEEFRMPLHAARLPSREIELLKRWIKQGAVWEDHWVFKAPKMTLLPDVEESEWGRRPFDKFVHHRLELEGLRPAPQAPKAEILRRASFDLTGLPPTPDELRQFLADESPDAYEKQVDRLLASTAYGERWATLWLDLSRYADSKGFDVDNHHTVWPYRDWLIKALNGNVPYDRFLIAQLAGDLLPNATLEDHIATTFNRLTPTNDEGGTDDEEFRLVAVMDRVATTWNVLNGLTINCVQCHSHPYDPIRHDEYYKALAFFNTSRDGDYLDEAPLLRVPTNETEYERAMALQRQISELSRLIVDEGRRREVSSSEWMPAPITDAAVDEHAGLQWYLAASESGEPLRDDSDVFESTPQERAKHRRMLIEAARKKIAEVARKEIDNTGAPAIKVGGGGIEVVGTVPQQSAIIVTLSPPGGPVTALRLEVSPKDLARARHTPEVGFVVDAIEAWIVGPGGVEERIEFGFFVPDSDEDLQRQLVRAEHFVARGRGSPFDAFGSTGGFSAYTKMARQHWVVAIPKKPIQVSSGSKIRLQLTQYQLIASKPATLPRLKVWSSTDESWKELLDNGTLENRLARLLDLNRQLGSISAIYVPIMQEQREFEQRPTLEFIRGNLLTKTGPPLVPDVPRSLPDLSALAPRNRLGLAEWFFSPGQPLTARVAVNRYWEQLFGVGLVQTLENFGSAGEEPSHPELLDWLAVHFERDLRWDVKALLREIVTSATYMQSARASSELRGRDPNNRLLARGPQQRLTAEMIRDQALLASGLLSARIGGPPVMPPQPPGIWKNVANSAKWIDATGEDRYRRAIYTFLKRSAIYPSFLTFDAATHDVSIARRMPTNTPLQALVTLNDPVYYEAAQALADYWLREINEQALTKEANVLDARLTDGALRVLSRDLSPEERASLGALFYNLLNESDPHSPSVPERKGVRSVDSATARTALTAIASVFLNLDAALTR